MNVILLSLMIMSLMMTSVPAMSAMWKFAETGAWKMNSRRYEEGYKIYSEPYAKWMLKDHSKETQSDLITQIKNTVAIGPVVFDTRYITNEYMEICGRKIWRVLKTIIFN